jgi:2-methylcitrate dehydratase
LTADDYEDDIAFDPRIDLLREKMEVLENKRFSADYLDPDKRSIGNAVQIFFNSGESTERIEIEYPLGHRLRRSEGLPLLKDKFEHNLERKFNNKQIKKITEIFNNQQRLEKMPVNKFMDLFSIT